AKKFVYMKLTTISDAAKRKTHVPKAQNLQTIHRGVLARTEMACRGKKNSNTLIVEGSMRMDRPYLTTLAREFRAGQGSFLLQLRIDMYWDKDAFRRLTEAMRACCKDYQYSPEQRARDLKEQEQLTEEQMEDEQFADEYYLQK